MSQGSYPPGYEPADGAQPPGRQPYEPYEGYQDQPTRRSSARIPQQQPEWPAPGPPRTEGFASPPGSYGGGQPTYRPESDQYGGYSDPSRDPYGAPGRDPYGDPSRQEPSRYGNLRYDEEGDLDGPPPGKRRRGLIIGVVVAAVMLIALAAVGVTYFMSSNSNTSFAVGSCVQKSGDKAVGAACSVNGAYQILSKVDSPTKCPDPAQPFVILQEKGKPDQVLCLKPAH
jgi:hypothetical protein